MIFKNLAPILISAVLGACANPKEAAELSPMESRRVEANAGVNAGASSKTCDARFGTSGLCVTWAWDIKPTAEEAGSFVFEIGQIDSNDQAFVNVETDILPTVLLWMPSMGHGSTPVAVTREGAGRFRASQVFFVMPGAWEIRIQLKEGATVRDETVLDFTF